MHFLYPSDPLRTKRPDEFYAAEFAAIETAGFGASVFSFEEFQAGNFKTFPALPSDTPIIYRGWMMSAKEYQSFDSVVTNCGARLLTETAAYLSTHHLPNWYPLLSDLTPETRIFPADADLAAELSALNWPEYFIKDYVKSLKTSIGSRVSTPEQASVVASEMKRYRGEIEGGFCVRRVEDFLSDTEKRFFVVDSIPFTSNGSVPPVVTECAKRVKSRFFSVDVVQRADGVLRIVEIGDGQVSDLVGWTIPRFVQILIERFKK